MSDNMEMKGAEIQTGNGDDRPTEPTLEGRDATPNAAEAGGDETIGNALIELKTRISELEAGYKALEEENSSLKDQYLRKQADFENFRKRMQKEKQEVIQFSNKQLLLDIVPVLDDFERAIKSAEESEDFTSFHDGILLIERQFYNLLERKWGLKRMDSKGSPFDPQFHEAIATEESKDHDQAVVIEDYQKGYLLHDKVLRAAKVKVSLPMLSGEEKDGGKAASDNPEGPVSQ